MNRANAIRIAASLSPTSRVLDVGGGNATFPAATHILDSLPWEARDNEAAKLLGDAIPIRYSRETWCQRDACDHTPWPWPDKYFDYATCSHFLEDVRDPIWACHELNRVAKAGYIEVPSRGLEQCLGIENPTYCGFLHHRWLISGDQSGANGLEFLHKPQSPHTTIRHCGENRR